MKPHLIKKSFKGTQDGQHDHHEFLAGTTAPLSKGLAAIVVKEGWAEPVIEKREMVWESSITGDKQTMTMPDREEKAIEAAPANKAIKAAPSNKKK